MYSGLLEPLLQGMKSWIAGYVKSAEMTPVLDLCCGIGTQCGQLRNRNISVYGVDLDNDMLGFASHKYPEIPFICGDAADLPFADNSFQAVVLSYALHGKSPEVRLKMLAEIKRTLTPQGRFLCLDFENPWDITSHIGRILTFGIEKMAGREHFNNGQQFLRQGGLSTFLDQNGLTEEKSVSVPLGNSRIVVARFD
jgi:ubiquinone/menaquinone biosynthesis C-methylase UbiE